MCPFSLALLIFIVAGSLKPITRDSGDPRPCYPITISHTLTHPFTHSGKVIETSQPTAHVFGLGEETVLFGENPRSTGKHANFHGVHRMAEEGLNPPAFY